MVWDSIFCIECHMKQREKAFGFNLNSINVPCGWQCSRNQTIENLITVYRSVVRCYSALQMFLASVENKQHIQLPRSSKSVMVMWLYLRCTYRTMHFFTRTRATTSAKCNYQWVEITLKKVGKTLGDKEQEFLQYSISLECEEFLQG